MAAKIKLGYAACLIAPDVIMKTPLLQIRGAMSLLIAASYQVPVEAWLVFLMKTCCEHIDNERFDKFVVAFRPWRLPDDPQDPLFDTLTPGGSSHILLLNLKFRMLLVSAVTSPGSGRLGGTSSEIDRPRFGISSR